MKDHGSLHSSPGILDLFLEVLILLLKITFIVFFSLFGIVYMMVRGK